LVVWRIFYFSIYWEESSQLTFIFFRGVETINQRMITRAISSSSKGLWKNRRYGIGLPEGSQGSYVHPFSIDVP
jgi:hypothetical protein